MLSVAAHGAGRPTAHVRNQVPVDEVVDGQFGPGALSQIWFHANKSAPALRRAENCFVS